MINYTWIVNNLLTVNFSSQEPNYVVTALYTVTAVDGDYNSIYSASASFEVNKSESGFIPYADLTEEIVIEWIKNQLSIDGVESVEASLAGQIETQKNPPPTPENTPLPWINN
jgi:hypothetical protein